MSVIPPAASSDGDGEPEGLSYAGLYLRADREAAIEALSDARFTGWLGPQQGPWLLAVARSSAGPVAGDGASLVTLGSAMAGQLRATVIAVRVERDRVLHLDGWLFGDGELTELGSYVSQAEPEPTGDPFLDEFAATGPRGTWNAPNYATACGRPEAGDDLTELLTEQLDPESVFESERLARALTLLGLPTWLVSAQSLPRDVPGGPAKEEILRLGAGRSGTGGRVAGKLTGWIRRRRPER